MSLGAWGLSDSGSSGKRIPGPSLSQRGPILPAGLDRPINRLTGSSAYGRATRRHRLARGDFFLFSPRGDPLSAISDLTNKERHVRHNHIKNSTASSCFFVVLWHHGHKLLASVATSAWVFACPATSLPGSSE